MPLYEYQCRACGHRFEAIRKFSDAPLNECPRCKGELEKLVSSPAFQFKGSGWYATDYAKKSEGAKSDSKSESQAETKTETKTDTKTETKSDTKSDATSKSSSSDTP
jgi:putative FmdB family regulatory protein